MLVGHRVSSCRKLLMPAASGKPDETEVEWEETVIVLWREKAIKPSLQRGRSHHANRHDFAEPTILRLTIICMSDRGLGQRPRQVLFFFAQSALLAVESGCVHQPE